MNRRRLLYYIVDRAVFQQMVVQISDRTAEGLTKNVDGGVTTYFAATSLSYDSVTDAYMNVKLGFVRMYIPQSLLVCCSYT